MTRIATGSRVVAALFVLFIFCAERTQAQTLVEIGPRVGYEVDDLESLFVGADARFGLPALPIKVNPYFDYYFLESDNVSLWQFGANALYEFGIANQLFTPYAGAGLALTRTAVDLEGADTEADIEPGLNLLFGARFGSGQMRPFAQAQITMGDAEFFTIGGGLLFRLGL